MLYTNHLIEHQKYYSDLASNADPGIVQTAGVYITEKDLSDGVNFDPSDTVSDNIFSPPPQSGPEHTNISIAKELSQHRQALIQSLAQLPLTALCLLQKHEQKCYNSDEDSLSSDNASDADAKLNTLSIYFQSAQQYALSEGLNSSNYFQAKQKIVDCLQAFPFSAEQLKKISALVIYTFYQNNLQQADQIKIHSPGQKNAFEKILNLSNLSSTQLQQELKQFGFEFFNNVSLSNFLLPLNALTQTLLEQIMATEQQWLKARQQLAEANTRLVFYIANHYKGSFLEFNDLVQEGQSGLLKAVDRFDHERGFQFSTYAAYWIRQAISRALTRNERVVRIPFGKMTNIHKVNRAKQQLIAQTGYEPSIRELARYTKLSEEDVANILIIAQTATSLDAPVDEDDNSATKADYLEQHVFAHPLNKISENELTQAINQAIGFLSHKEAQVINCRFGINSKPEMTLEEIGHELHLTRERVRQIQIAAMQKIKRHFGANLSIFL